MMPWSGRSTKVLGTDLREQEEEQSNANAIPG